MQDLDGELVGRIRGLTLEFMDKPQPELLVSIPNRSQSIHYWIEVTTKEFTSLCPLNTSQPDYATIYIRYRPREWLVELKSLKFYLVSFRMVPIFHEEVPATILRSLTTLLSPAELIVTGDFTTRGGLHTVVEAVYPNV